MQKYHDYVMTFKYYNIQILCSLVSFHIQYLRGRKTLARSLLHALGPIPKLSVLPSIRERSQAEAEQSVRACVFLEELPDQCTRYYTFLLDTTCTHARVTCVAYNVMSDR
jgi:hypothetical protein